MDEPLSVLFVCTGNICRSPMAEGLARGFALGRRPDLAGRLSISSAGVAGLDGEPVTVEAVAAMRERGIDISAHRARSTSRALLERSDLVLVMEELQRRYLEPVAGRTPVFLLLRFAEACRAWSMEVSPPAGDEALSPRPRDVLSAVLGVAGRLERGDLWERPAFACEIGDPLGMRLDAYERLASAMAEPVELIVATLLRSGDGPRLA